MEDGGGEEDGCSGLHGVEEVLQFASAAGGDDGGLAGVSHRFDDGQVITGLRAVAGLGGRQDDIDAVAIDLLGPFDGVGARGGAAAVDIDFVAGRQFRIDIDVDGDGQRVDAELFDDFRNDFRLAEGGGADGDAVGARVEDFRRGFDILDAAADGERDGAGRRRPFDDVQQGAAVFDGGADVEKREFIGSGGAIGACAFDGIARVGDVDEMDAFDDAAVLHVEAGHDGDWIAHGRSFLINGERKKVV